MPDDPIRDIDPIRCWIRHVRQAQGIEVGTFIGGASFVQTGIDALVGPQGWQSSTVLVTLNDHGEATLRLPNTAGEDGRLHRRRFGIFTTETYRPGEEWIEVYREPHDVLCVWTPTSATKTRSEITLKGYDVAGVLGRYRGSELDLWDDGYAPRDVWEHYTRAPGIAYATEFVGFTLPVPWDVWDKTTTTGGSLAIGPHGGPRLISLPVALSEVRFFRPHPSGIDGDCWTAEARMRVVDAPVAGTRISVQLGGVWMAIYPNGDVVAAAAAVGVNVAGPGTTTEAGKAKIQWPGALSVRIVARYERVFVQVNGVIILEWRRQGQAWPGAPQPIVIMAEQTTVDVASVYIETLRALALRGVDKGSRRLPGIPPSGGLRARYYSISPQTIRYTVDAAQRLSRIWRLSDSEARIDRLEPNGPDHPKTTFAFSGPGTLIGGPWSARWTGSIYLDLATSDRRLRIGENAFYTRIYVGKTRRGIDHYAQSWAAASGPINQTASDDAGFENTAFIWATTAAWWIVAGATLTRQADARIEGGYGGRIQTAGLNNQGAWTVPAVPPLSTGNNWIAGRKYRFVIYVRGKVGGEQIILLVGGSGDSITTGAITLPGPTQPAIGITIEWTPTANRVIGSNYCFAIRNANVSAAAWDIDRFRITDHGTVGSPTDALQGANLRAHLGTSEAGWYPIVIETAFFAQSTGLGPLEGAAVDAAGNALNAGVGWQIIPSSQLSPIGCYEEQNRNEPHRGIIDQLAETFGYQWRTEPRTLESGEFPGQVIPRVRAGRDTSRVLTDIAGVDIQADVDAADTIDSLVADAAGIADVGGSGQLNGQITNTGPAYFHLGISSDYESLAEITEPPMLEMRLASLLALRSSPNEQVGMRVDGQRDLVDTFPLTGGLSRLKWEPGDGIRLQLQDVDVIDATPRQITRVSYELRQDASAPPVAGFRQRPRDPAAVLRRTLRAVYATSRNYQGTLALVPGSLIYNTVGVGGATGDSYAMLPEDITRVVAAYIDVSFQDSASTCTFYVNTVATTVKSTAPGRYDLTPWLAPFGVAPATDRRFIVSARDFTVGATFQGQVSLLVRV